MINQLQFEVHDSRGRRTIRYTHGVKSIEYVSVNSSKCLRVYLSDDYICEDKALLPDYNESCEPFQHRFQNVEYVNID